MSDDVIGWVALALIIINIALHRIERRQLEREIATLKSKLWEARNG